MASPTENTEGPDNENEYQFKKRLLDDFFDNDRITRSAATINSRIDKNPEKYGFYTNNPMRSSIGSFLEELASKGYLTRKVGRDSTENYIKNDKTKTYNPNIDEGSDKLRSEMYTKDAKNAAQLLKPLGKLREMRSNEVIPSDKDLAKLQSFYMVEAAWIDAYKFDNEPALKRSKNLDAKDPTEWSYYFMEAVNEIKRSGVDSHRWQQWEKAGMSPNDKKLSELVDKLSEIHETAAKRDKEKEANQIVTDKDDANKLLHKYATELWYDSDFMTKLLDTLEIYSSQNSSNSLLRRAREKISPALINESNAELFDRVFPLLKEPTPGDVKKYPSIKDLYEKVSPKGGLMNMAEFAEMILSLHNDNPDKLIIDYSGLRFRFRWITDKEKADDNPAGYGKSAPAPIGSAPNSQNQANALVEAMFRKFPNISAKIFMSGFSRLFNEFHFGNRGWVADATAFWQTDGTEKHGEKAWQEIKQNFVEPSAKMTELMANQWNAGNDPIRPLATMVAAAAENITDDIVALRVFGQGGTDYNTDDAKILLEKMPDAVDVLGRKDNAGGWLILHRTEKEGTVKFLRDGEESEDSTDTMESMEKNGWEFRVEITPEYNVIGKARDSDEKVNADWAFGFSKKIQGVLEKRDADRNELIKEIYSDIPIYQDLEAERKLMKPIIHSAAMIIVNNLARMEMRRHPSETFTIMDVFASDERFLKALNLNDVNSKNFVSKLKEAAKDKDWELDWEAWREFRQADDTPFTNIPERAAKQIDYVMGELLRPIGKSIPAVVEAEARKTAKEEEVQKWIQQRKGYHRQSDGNATFIGSERPGLSRLMEMENLDSKVLSHKYHKEDPLARLVFAIFGAAGPPGWLNQIATIDLIHSYLFDVQKLHSSIKKFFGNFKLNSIKAGSEAIRNRAAAYYSTGTLGDKNTHIIVDPDLGMGSLLHEVTHAIGGTHGAEAQHYSAGAVTLANEKGHGTDDFDRVYRKKSSKGYPLSAVLRSAYRVPFLDSFGRKRWKKYGILSPLTRRIRLSVCKRRRKNITRQKIKGKPPTMYCARK